MQRHLKASDDVGPIIREKHISRSQSKRREGKVKRKEGRSRHIWHHSHSMDIPSEVFREDTDVRCESKRCMRLNQRAVESLHNRNIVMLDVMCDSLRCVICIANSIYTPGVFE